MNMQVICFQRLGDEQSNVPPCLFLFPHREQRGVQETCTVDNIHRHGDQPSGDPVYGPLLPQQVREQNNKNIPINVHH